MAKARRKDVYLSDLHVGSTVGLWPATFPIEGGGPLGCNVYQKWLLECWKVACAEIAAIRPRPRIILNGDPVQGVKNCDGQLMTNKTDIQADAAYELLDPVRAVARQFYMVRGTEWHEGKAAEHVEQLAKRLDAQEDPASGARTWWELLLDMDGPVAHVAHHIGTSSVPWYEATVPLRDTLMYLAEVWRFFGQAGPNVRLVVRSHRHRGVYIQVPPNIHVMVTPGWQLKTAFAYKRAGASLPQIGYGVVEWRDGVMLGRLRTFPLPAPHVEVRE